MHRVMRVMVLTVVFLAVMGGMVMACGVDVSIAVAKNLSIGGFNVEVTRQVVGVPYSEIGDPTVTVWNGDECLGGISLTRISDTFFIGTYIPSCSLWASYSGGITFLFTAKQVVRDMVRVAAASGTMTNSVVATTATASGLDPVNNLKIQIGFEFTWGATHYAAVTATT